MRYKKISLHICVFIIFQLTFSLMSSAQTQYRISYDLNYRPDSSSQNIHQEKTELLIMGDSSVFRTVDKSIRASGQYIILSKPGQAAITYEIFKVFTNDNIIFYDGILAQDGKTYSYTENMRNMDWKLIDVYDSIGNFFCQKATLDYGNRKWEAWFSPEIPLMDGPYKFCGLPGLIVEIKDSTDSYTFSLSHIERVDDINFYEERWKKSFTITKQEYYQQLKHYKNNEFQILETGGWITPRTTLGRSSMIKKFDLKNKKTNNWIESIN